MSLIGFLKSRLFLKHTILAILLTVVLIWLILKGINLFTRHGSYIIVADFKGIHLSKLDEFASDNDLEYQIIDSLYDNSLPNGTVAMQDPDPGSKVKKNRKIYITVVASKPEMTDMPNLVDLTLRQGTAMLETYGLKTGSLKYVPDIAHNAILRQFYNGREIKTGTKIEKGSRIDLVIGRSEENSSTSVPDLYGKKQAEAIELLQAASLNIGNEIFLDGNDTSHARVYKQRPDADVSATYGSSVDLWYRSDKKFEFKNNH